MSSTKSTLSRLAILSAGAIGLYSTLIGILLQPGAQRFALYANKFNTLFWHDLNYPLQFGFADGQVTPFNLGTPDGQTLYAWHVLPLDVYARNEKLLRTGKRHRAPVNDFTSTLPFRLLTNTTHPLPRVVISFHGNAGHIAQGMRAGTYRSLATHPNTHVLTIDYRGFGHSTGYPTEAGLIEDATALVKWIMDVAKIPPERIVILGQSLGTAVSSAVALNFADPSSKLIPHLEHTDSVTTVSETLQSSKPTAFAGIVLAAPFSSIPSLLATYRIGGMFSLLLPLRPFPWLLNAVTSRAVDTWQSARRLEAYSEALSNNPALLSTTSDDVSGNGVKTTREMGAVQVIHAVNDKDITYHETEYICSQVVGAGNDCIDGSHGPALFELKEQGAPRFRFEIVQHGGHNTLVTYSPVALAIIRAFEGFA